MSGSGPPFGGNPFEGFPLFGDLARMFAAQGPVNWDVARQMALWIATEGKPQGNVNPIERIRLEELARVADLHVSSATGLSTSIAGGILSVLPVSRGDWALHSLESYRPVLERLATSLSEADPESVDPDPSTDLLGNLGKMLGPVLLGLQSGVMLGHLARHSFGQYDLPLPRRPADQLLIVPANIDAFASEWGLEADDLRMLVCLAEITHHAVIGRPHVRARLMSLLEDYVSKFSVDPTSLESSFSEVNLSDPGEIQRLLGQPETLLGAVQSPEQNQIRERIEILLTAVVGYVDHVLETVGRPLIGSYDKLMEAMRRRRAEASDGERFAGRLLGLELGRPQYERGAAFVRGVVERAGEEGLTRLWRSERELPTGAELDAPGLWLARIDLPD
ncbi:MAG: zinc-dependent metalloprotease [Actinomycetota bacterium]|nr:zinc-dependent metalloprotease [Actinomycetota bacterium]